MKSRFPTAGHLVSWAGLCPRNDESAGKRRSTRLRKGAIRPQLDEFATALVREWGAGEPVGVLGRSREGRGAGQGAAGKTGTEKAGTANAAAGSDGGTGGAQGPHQTVCQYLVVFGYQDAHGWGLLVALGGF